jgi:glycosyltransferase involved in cell wall biosynthesis
VARLVRWLPVGGVERKLVELLPRLDPDRFRVLLIHTDARRGPLADELERRGIPVYFRSLRQRLSPLGLWSLARFLRAEGVDILHTHMYPSNASGTVAGRFARVPAIVAHIHQVRDWTTRRRLALDRRLYGSRDAIVAVSEHVRRDYLGGLGQADDGRVRVIYNGVDLERFRCVDGSDARRELGLGEAPTAILLASLTRKKNHENFLRAAALVRRSLPEARFLVVGTGPRRESLEALVEAWELRGKVLFTGLRDDVPELLAASDLLVLSSDKEGFPNAVLEAMASGRPAVVTDVGGCREAVEDGETGLVVPPRDSTRLAAAMLRMLRDPALRRRAGEKARRRAETFSIETMRRRTEELYLELLGGKGR